MRRNIILIGGGGHCKSCIDVIENEGVYDICGILDSKHPIGTEILNYRVVGDDASIQNYLGQCDFLLTVGQISDPELRIKLFSKVKEAGGNFAKIISRVATVSRYSSIGEGSVIMHGVVVNSDVSIGINCIINTLANIEHDVVIGDHCHISTGALINGGVEIGHGCFIGSGAVISHGVSIAENVVIGAGSYVMRSVTRPGVFAGNPAKFLKEI